jgi:preprotein translocase subunit Sss1
LNRAIALEALYRPREAIEEYRAVLKLSPKPAAAELVRSQILRLEGGGR